MNTLFEMEPVLPPGFSYYTGFISPAEEQELLQQIAQFDLKNMQFHEYEAKRKVASFGKGWSFTEQQLKQGEPIPQEFQFLVSRIADKLGIPEPGIAQFLITEYPPGSVINWHRDAPPFHTIAGVSLFNPCTFKLRPHEKAQQTRAATIAMEVQPRSLYIMTGKAKNEWQHCTAPVKEKRYSLTFRTLKDVQQ